MRIVAFILVFVTIICPALAENEVRIVDIKQEKGGVARKFGLFSGTPSHYVPDPQIVCRVVVSSDFYAQDLEVVAYYFDKNHHQLGDRQRPRYAYHPSKDGGEHYEVPPIYKKGAVETLYFAIPPEIKDDLAEAVCVCITANQTVAKTNSSLDVMSFDFPEKEKILVGPDVFAEKKDHAVAHSVIEYKVQTGVASHPVLTLFLRFPSGITDSSEVKGVLATCALVNSIGSIRQGLEEMSITGGTNNLYQYAEEHKMAILAWGPCNVFGANASAASADVDKGSRKEIDQPMDTLADAWDKGVQHLCDTYGMPEGGYLIDGWSKAAQLVHRIVLRKPERFLGIHINVCGNYDEPTEKGRHSLWLVTTGELDGGYLKTKQFCDKCQALHYPILFKAEPLVGHASSAEIDALTFAFFDYCLSRKELYDRYSKNGLDKLEWPTDSAWDPNFVNPPYFGDRLNQFSVAVGDVSLIPAGQRVPIPTLLLKELWDAGNRD